MVWAFVLLAVAALATGCSDSDAYPNDQDRIEQALADAGLDSVSVTGREEWNLGEWSSSVTVIYFTDKLPPSETDLSIVRRVVWEQYPHRLEALAVDVKTQDDRQGVHFTREQLAAELGTQAYRDDDSDPLPSGPLLPKGMLVSLVIGGVAVLGLITWGALQSRSSRRKDPPASSTAAAARAPEPPPTASRDSRRFERRVRFPQPQPSTAATPPVEPPVEPPAPIKHEPVRPSRRRNFEETQAALNNAWQYLDGLVPDPPKRNQAAYKDNWLAERSGVPVEKITFARQARNTATHRPDEIDRATMNRAIEVIDDVAQKIAGKPD